MSNQADVGAAAPAFDHVPTGSPQAGSLNLLSAIDFPIELVFGFVGPTGVNLTEVSASLEAQLRAVNYEAYPIRLSELLLKRTAKKESDFEDYDRIHAQIEIGNDLCRKFQKKDMVGRLGLSAIREKRASISGDENQPHATRRIAYIVRSFKRKQEVELFRNTYGKAFTLISVYAPKQKRIASLAKRFRAKKSAVDTTTLTPNELAVRIVERDHTEHEDEYGQRVAKSFPLADFFVSVAPRAELDKQFGRLVRLTLGDPYLSPTREEQGMFFAQAAALRSLDLSRQVGAAIASPDGEVLSTGCNEVPKFRGGLYWGEDSDCRRDVEYGRDANVTIKTELVEDAVRILREKGWSPPEGALKTDAEIAREMLFGQDAYFEGAKLYDVIEFGRAVHAEMDAISQAARLGISLQGARLFCTTFPCHICARHIIAAGITKVWFIEPYEKSRTAELYADSISVEPDEQSMEKANFCAFVGVAPRRYMDMFQLVSERKRPDGSLIEQSVQELQPKFKRFVFSYILAELLFVQEFKQLLKATQGESND